MKSMNRQLLRRIKSMLRQNLLEKQKFTVARVLCNFFIASRVLLKDKCSKEKDSWLRERFFKIS